MVCFSTEAAQLGQSRPQTGNHVWAERYDRDLANIFAVQDEITEAVTIAIAPAIAEAERQRAMRRPPESLDAWPAPWAASRLRPFMSWLIRWRRKARLSYSPAGRWRSMVPMQTHFPASAGRCKLTGSSRARSRRLSRLWQ